MAIYVGPAGIALSGQLNNLFGIITPLSVGGLNVGITKFISEFNEKNTLKRSQIVVITALITVFFSFFFGCGIVFFSELISNSIFHDANYSIIIKLVGLTLPLTALNLWSLSILNGLKAFKRFNLVNIISNLLSLIITTFLAITYGIKGALISIVITQSLASVLSVWFVIQLLKSWIVLKIDNNSYWVFKVMAEYALMAIVTAITVPVAQLFIRNFINSNLSLNEAGYWESLNRISAIHLLFITTSLVTYVLPRLSELTNPIEIKAEVRQFARVIIPIVTVTSIGIFIFRKFIIELLFTTSFMQAEPLFAMQMVGDFFKIISWIFGMYLLAKAKVGVYLLGEIVFSLILYLLTVFLVNKFGLVGTSYAYALVYFLYLIYCFLWFRYFNRINS
jgi:PST family polysaccharide transporter